MRPMVRCSQAFLSSSGTTISNLPEPLEYPMLSLNEVIVTAKLLVILLMKERCRRIFLGTGESSLWDCSISCQLPGRLITIKKRFDIANYATNLNKQFHSAPELPNSCDHGISWEEESKDDVGSVEDFHIFFVVYLVSTGRV